MNNTDPWLHCPMCGHDEYFAVEGNIRLHGSQTGRQFAEMYLYVCGDCGYTAMRSRSDWHKTAGTRRRAGDNTSAETVDVYLLDGSGNPEGVAAALVKRSGLSEAEAYSLIWQTPACVASELTPYDGEVLVRQLEGLGGVAELRRPT